MHPWSFYGCKVTDWSTVTLTFNFPLGVLACDLEGAHFSQERRLDLSMDNHFKKSFCVESRSVVDPLKLQLKADSVACFCRILRRTIRDVTECNSQVDALKHISEVACDLRNNHTPSNASETCPNQLQTGSSTPLESIL